jgi:succinoglycan biosynthesis protein ExoA
VSTRPAVDVSVLTPVLDEEEHLPGVLERMLGQRMPGTVEFLFIDGGSRDRSRAILTEAAARDPRVRVLDNPARRTPQALNIGLRASRGTYVARMDAHTHYPPHYLAMGAERLARGDVASVSGPQLAVGEGRWSRRVALALRTPLGVGGARFRREQDREVEVDSGFTGMWRRDTLLAQGGWDEEWLNDQDLELAARLRKDGGRIVCLPAMAASYIPRDDLAALARQYGRYGFYRVKTSRRHPESLRRSQVLPPALALTVLAAAVQRPRPLARAARAGIGVYALALLAASASASRQAGPRDAAAVPLVLLAMHLAYGAGFLRAAAELGPPWAALAGAAGIRAAP